MKLRSVVIVLAVMSAMMALVYSQVASSGSGPEDEAKTILASYASALNQKKADVIELSFSDGIDLIDDAGNVTSGKANVMELLKGVLDKDSDFSIKLALTSAKRVGNDVMLIDGTSEVTFKGDKNKGRFESIWLRNGNRWQMNRVREFVDPADENESNEAKLKELSWIVGEWTAETADYQLSLTAKWGANKNFLNCEYAVTQKGKSIVTITKVVGWDAVNEQIRTWVFDSDGGFGGSFVSRVGNSWVEQFDSQTRSGSTSSTNHSIRMMTESSFEWLSTDRELDGVPLPDLKVVYTRKK